MKVLIAPDSFKGTATAVDVAAALAEGWLSVRGGDDVSLMPQADGGEGTLDAIAASGPWHRRIAEVAGPDGRSVRAQWLLDDSGRAVVELAEASGIALMSQLDPWRATSLGLGEVINAALSAGARSVQVGLGGSASTDGGLGVLTALGLRAVDRAGRPVPGGAAGLRDVVRADATALTTLPPGGVELLVDTRAPLYGPRGAPAVFGPQKGATADDIDQLDAALRHWTEILRDGGLTADPDHAGAGAAGGVGFGLLAWGATTTSGSARIAALTGLDRRLPSADLILTGEGRFDRSSLTGKLVGSVLEASAQAGVPALVVAGQVGGECPVPAISLTGLAGSSSAAVADPLRWLCAAGAAAAQQV